MELLLLVGAFVALDLAAHFFGHDSRDTGPLDHHDRALGALRRGDLSNYREEMGELEREASRVSAIRF
jgi:hypothetical protein